MSNDDQAASEPLRVLHVEDDPHDRELARATLAADGLVCRVQCVDTRSDFEAALLCETFDVILADYSLPRFDGLTAQAIARSGRAADPVHLPVGTLGEELAIERLKDGATDYVLKQRLAPPAGGGAARAERGLRTGGAAARGRRRAAPERGARSARRRPQRGAGRRDRNTRAARTAMARLGRPCTRSWTTARWRSFVKDLDGRYVFVNRQFEQSSWPASEDPSARRAPKSLRRGMAESIGPRSRGDRHAASLTSRSR